MSNKKIVRRIPVNNGMTEYIEFDDWGMTFTQTDEHGEVQRRDLLDDGEIVMVANLIRYMRDNDIKSAYIPEGHEDEMRRYLNNLLDNGDLADLRIFQ